MYTFWFCMKNRIHKQNEEKKYQTHTLSCSAQNGNDLAFDSIKRHETRKPFDFTSTI